MNTDKFVKKLNDVVADMGDGGEAPACDCGMPECEACAMAADVPEDVVEGETDKGMVFSPVPGATSGSALTAGNPLINAGNEYVGDKVHDYLRNEIRGRFSGKSDEEDEDVVEGETDKVGPIVATGLGAAGALAGGAMTKEDVEDEEVIEDETDKIGPLMAAGLGMGAGALGAMASKMDDLFKELGFEDETPEEEEYFDEPGPVVSEGDEEVTDEVEAMHLEHSLKNADDAEKADDRKDIAEDILEDEILEKMRSIGVGHRPEVEYALYTLAKSGVSEANAHEVVFALFGKNFVGNCTPCNDFKRKYDDAFAVCDVLAKYVKTGNYTMGAVTPYDESIVRKHKDAVAQSATALYHELFLKGEDEEDGADDGAEAEERENE